jgi:hypothetical protein
VSREKIVEKLSTLRAEVARSQRVVRAEVPPEFWRFRGAPDEIAEMAKTEAALGAITALEFVLSEWKGDQMSEDYKPLFGPEGFGLKARGKKKKDRENMTEGLARMLKVGPKIMEYKRLSGEIDAEMKAIAELIGVDYDKAHNLIRSGGIDKQGGTNGNE